MVMFTKVTQLAYQTSREHEYIWSANEGPQCLLAGALLGSSVIRVRCVRGSQLDTSRYQLAITDKSTSGTLPYHSWMVIKGDEQWPDYFNEADAQTILQPYLHQF